MDYDTEGVTATSGMATATVSTSSSASGEQGVRREGQVGMEEAESRELTSTRSGSGAAAAGSSATPEQGQVFGSTALSTSTVTSASEASSLTTESSAAAKSETDEHKRAAADSGLSFRAGVVCIPHPDKADKGGEDAFFVQKSALGVFDGVGGWAAIGVDAGLYSKQLARLTADYVVNEGPASIVDALKNATDKNRAVGSSTACVVGLDGRQLVGVNVGDSGLLVIRDGTIVYKTTEQQHYFNCPYQIGTDSLDSVEVGGPIKVQLQHGDWIVMGTDGLWDNIFPEHLVDIVLPSRPAQPQPQQQQQQRISCDSSSFNEDVRLDDASKKTSTPSSISEGGCSGSGSLASRVGGNQQSPEYVERITQELGEQTVRAAHDDRGSSPFAKNAREAGHLYFGGKVDDITIICAIVMDAAVLAAEAETDNVSRSAPKANSNL